MFFIFQHLLWQFSNANIKVPSNVNTVEALLATARAGSLRSKRHILVLAIKLGKDLKEAHLQAEIVYHQSVLLRFEGNVEESGRVVKEFYNKSYHTEQRESHPVLGSLCLSQANNLWQSDTLWEQVFCAGRIFRGEGHFEKAQHCFERCLTTAQLPEVERIRIANLADLYCELDYQHKQKLLHPKVDYLVKEEAIIESEIVRLRTYAYHSEGLRRLLSSSIEIGIRQGSYPEENSLTEELLKVHDELADPGIIDRLGHIRALIASARLSPPSQVEKQWEAALRQNVIYNPLEDEVFTSVVIHLFISLARF
ncbi:uncharacterized protein Z518_05053 [Rhinocladiella mackenziei CBS 650.93]|uniref:Protein ZIP4 homolog n=1 Tax=Rhinocladiella mackenziei CBS 650.93 TaxID=1442369 RepID=A0A0D2IV82_9EURO|nr:uncharacterized protein Z518_05053 [Rhinocladiella mackenziei CBS 650.93]KIX07076.1 hypothetical protein Z518_05053 [Rhinocladiella mackenziei CBS 650.93]